MSGLVTVFGGTGFVGTYVVRALARRGWRIRVAARRPRLGSRVLTYGDVGQIQLIAADVTKRESVDAALEGATACINLVGLLTQSAGRTFRKIHVDGAATVAAAAAAAKVERFVQVSALGADPRAPSLYARTKAEAEEAVRKAIPGAIVLRPSVVFGPEDDFFNRFGALAARSPVLPLIGGGKTRFQPVYVNDVAEAAAAALARDDAAGRTFELGGPTVYTFKELMQLTEREACRKRLLLPVPFVAAELLGLGGDLLAFAGLSPALTTDQVRLLKRDNVAGAGAPGLADLGVVPTAAESILPSYLWLYRRGGQFAEQPVA
jgi:NADH dehydrogenase